MVLLDFVRGIVEKHLWIWTTSKKSSNPIQIMSKHFKSFGPPHCNATTFCLFSVNLFNQIFCWSLKIHPSTDFKTLLNKFQDFFEMRGGFSEVLKLHWQLRKGKLRLKLHLNIEDNETFCWGTWQTPRLANSLKIEFTTPWTASLWIKVLIMT
jgi:hypothetical protein